jgi:hypothetical protein
MVQSWKRNRTERTSALTYPKWPGQVVPDDAGGSDEWFHFSSRKFAIQEGCF